MGSTKDFVAATVADAMLPWFRRPVEDVIYETIDKRQIPNRTDFKEIRDLVNNLRGQLTGATGGVKRLAETTDELEERLDELEDKIAALTARVEKAEALEARIAALEARPADAAPAPAPVAAPATPVAAKTCKVDGCDKSIRAKGFCASHYQRWRRGTLEGFDAPE
jgi:polyhydroxyalkanoate synthesis regulator phasin